MNHKRLNICQVLASTGDGGLEKHVRELGSELATTGHRVHVIAPEDFISTLPTTVEGHALPLQRGRLNPLSLIMLARKLRRLDCDIVHAHATKAAFMTGLIKPLLHCPTIATVHNIKRNVSPYLRHDRIIAVSRTLSEAFPSDKVEVVYHGIRPPMSRTTELRATFNLPPKQTVLLAVGRLVNAKGFDILLQAVSGMSVSLLIAGEGPERRALERLATECQPPTVVRLLGHRSDVASLIANADAVIIPSRREGFSYVFGEALLLRKPVLSSDVPIPNEVLPEKLIIPVGSIPELRNRLSALLEDMDDWHRDMMAAFDYAERQLTIRAMTEHTLAIYQRLLNT